MGTPARGDLIIVDFNPQAGHEQAGRRTGIVLSPEQFNDVTGFASICPITNQEKGYPYEVILPKDGIPVPSGKPVTGVILTDQVKTLDWKARKVKVIGQASEEIVEDCLAKIATYLM